MPLSLQLMSDQHESTEGTLVDELAGQGYWPALAAQYLAEGKYSRAVAVCKEHLSVDGHLVSGRLIYASALKLAGQVESAAEQFYYVLSHDPSNVVALKCLGDIQYAAGDEITAMADYLRVLEIDPYCRGLASKVESRPKETTRTITLKHGEDSVSEERKRALRRIPFYTETIGDLYLAQGYPRLAAEVFRKLSDSSASPRIREKLNQAEKKVTEKDI